MNVKILCKPWKFTEMIIHKTAWTIFLNIRIMLYHSFFYVVSFLHLKFFKYFIWNYRLSLAPVSTVTYTQTLNSLTPAHSGLPSILATFNSLPWLVFPILQFLVQMPPFQISLSKLPSLNPCQVVLCPMRLFTYFLMLTSVWTHLPRFFIYSWSPPTSGGNLFSPLSPD